MGLSVRFYVQVFQLVLYMNLFPVVMTFVYVQVMCVLLSCLSEV